MLAGQFGVAVNEVCMGFTAWTVKVYTKQSDGRKILPANIGLGLVVFSFVQQQ
jgi:hypothetical protein